MVELVNTVPGMAPSPSRAGPLWFNTSQHCQPLPLGVPIGSIGEMRGSVGKLVGIPIRSVGRLVGTPLGWPSYSATLLLPKPVCINSLETAVILLVIPADVRGASCAAWQTACEKCAESSVPCLLPQI